jgi:hypothetical protein
MSEIARAKRPFFAAKSGNKEGCIYYEKEVEFDWHKGMSWQVRQRSSLAMAQVIEEMYPKTKGRILEVSTKSSNFELGSALSAMNLIYTDLETQEMHSIENWFQASKQFSREGKLFGPYTELLNVDPKSAKRFVNSNLHKKIAEQYAYNAMFNRIQNEIKGARLSSFVFRGKNYKTEPKSAFYDYIYSKALNQNQKLANAIKDYTVFTDIEFNPIMSGRVVRYNTQARACAIFVALLNKGLLNIALENFDSFIDSVQYETDNADESNCSVQMELPFFKDNKESLI